MNGSPPVCKLLLSNKLLHLLGEKVSENKNFISSRDGLEKMQKQGRMRKPQEPYPTME